MSFTLILQAILAILKFPKELGDFIRLLEKSPEEKRQEIHKKVLSEFNEMAKDERPTWEAP